MLSAHRRIRPLLLLLVLGWPVVVGGQSASLEGRVVIDGGLTPLSGATVAWSEGATLRTVFTNERGTFSLPVSGPRPQRLAVVKAGFVTQIAPLDPQGGAIEIPLHRGAIGAGIVRDVDGMSVANAVVKLQQVTAAGDGLSWTVKTDDRGEFRTSELPPGQYRVHTIGTLAIDDVGPGTQMLSDDVTVNLGVGASTRIALTHRRAADPPKVFPRGAITGVIVDAAGEPVSGITVVVFRGRKQGIRRDLTPLGIVQQTDHEGRYRVFDLMPGKYVVQATDERPFIRTLGANVDVPTYYPSAVAASEAVQLRVVAGQELGGIDIRLRRERYLKVSGVVVHTGPIPPSIALTRSGTPGAFVEPIVMTRVSGAGTFEFPKVVPGEYLLQADAEQTERSPFVISVASDLEGLVVRTVPPRRLTGRLTFEGAPAEFSQFRQLRLSFRPVDVAIGGAARGSLNVVLVRNDWTFEVVAPSGMGRFVLRDASQGWFVKRVDEASARPAHEPFDPSDGAEITLVVARATGFIEGTVRGSATPGHERYVVAFSADERLWYEDSPCLATVTADDSARFAMPPLPPGDYLVAAIDGADIDVPAGELDDPQVLRELIRDAARVSVRDGARQQVTVTLLPPR